MVAALRTVRSAIVESVAVLGSHGSSLASQWSLLKPVQQDLLGFSDLHLLLVWGSPTHPRAALQMPGD
eukprot:15478249-Alexandrium_andersonii.AAC.1